LGQQLDVPLGEPDIDTDIATIDEPTVRQRILKSGGERLEGIRRRQDADNREIFRICGNAEMITHSHSTSAVAMPLIR